MAKKSADAWGIDLDEQAGFLGDRFLRAHAEGNLLSAWLGTEWHLTAYKLGTTPRDCLPGVKALAGYIADSFIDHLAEADWLDVEESWEDNLRREGGISKQGIDQKNFRVNLAEELRARFNRWYRCMDDEEAHLEAASFRLGALNPFSGSLRGAPLDIVDGKPLEDALKAQQLVEIWHECLGRVYDSWNQHEEPTAIGIRLGVIHVFLRVSPHLAPEKHHLTRDGFETWMNTLHDEYLDGYRRLVGFPPEGRRHLAILRKSIGIGQLASLAKGKGRVPATPHQALAEAFMGRPIQVINPAEGSYFYLGPGLLSPLLQGIVFVRWKDAPRVRILQLRHESDHDSIAILLPTVTAFNVGLGGWLVCPFYWTAGGSIGPSRFMHMERILESHPNIFDWHRIDVPYEEFKAFLQNQAIGKPDWLSEENLHAVALGWERKKLLPKAQSLILELLAERYAWQVLECESVKPGLSIGNQECDIVAETPAEAYHMECQNSVWAIHVDELLEEFQRKKALLQARVGDKPIVQYLVTRQAAIDAGTSTEWLQRFADEEIRVLTFERDLLPLFPKQAGRDRLSSMFPGVIDDPVLKIQEDLEKFMSGSATRKRNTRRL